MPVPQTDGHFGHDVTVTFSPRKAQCTFTRSDQTALTPLSLSPSCVPPTVAIPTSSVFGVVGAQSDGHSEAGSMTYPTPIYSGNGLPTPIVHCADNPKGGYGRKYMGFYVISRGLQTGVFYDYW
jgi:hypothetical protein